MKILILEDDPERIHWFYKKFFKHDITCTNSVDGAIRCIKDKEYDIIFLDHDLGGKVFCNHQEEPTGYHVACMIPSSENKNTMVIIHSWNSPAAKLMKEHLVAATDYTGTVVTMVFGTFDETNFNTG